MPVRRKALHTVALLVPRTSEPHTAEPQRLVCRRTTVLAWSPRQEPGHLQHRHVHWPGCPRSASNNHRLATLLPNRPKVRGQPRRGCCPSKASRTMATMLQDWWMDSSSNSPANDALLVACSFDNLVPLSFLLRLSTRPRIRTGTTLRPTGFEPAASTVPPVGLVTWFRR